VNEKGERDYAAWVTARRESKLPSPDRCAFLAVARRCLSGAAPRIADGTLPQTSYPQHYFTRDGSQ